MSDDEVLPLTVDELLAVGTARYDAAVPTPEAVLGWPLGARLCRHADCVNYLAALAAASPQASLAAIGRSVEGRELVQLTIASAANLARLDEIRAATTALADPAAPLPELPGLPVVIWVMANVHGGEYSSAEATLRLAYQLLAGQDEVTAGIRRDAVVVIDPLQNPDGRDRAVNGYYSLHGVVANPDRHSAEHITPWPGPRGSHYAFDLNRDWCLLTHPETRARVRSFLAWRPQLVLDLHEMWVDESYYFPPTAVPVEANVATSLRDWWHVYGRANAAAFDRRGWDYFVGEVFDAYYPGYGEVWPLFHGALGMTFEQAAALTVAVRRKDGQVQTLAEATAHHFVAAFTSCATAVAHREALLQHTRTHAAETVALGAAGPHRALLLDAGDRPADAAEVAATLRAQGVQLEVAGEALTVTVTAHEGGPARPHTLAAGSLVIPLAQPAGRLVRALADPVSPLPEAFAAAEQERRRRRAEPEIYDITAWSLPHRHGLTAWWSATVPAVTASRPSAPLGEATLAYVAPAGTRASQRLLARLATAGDWRPRVTSRTFSLAGREYGRGSLILRGRDHAPGLGARLAALAAETGAEIQAADSSWTAGGVSLGSLYINTVERPRIAMLTRAPVQAEAAGWLAYLLEQEYHLPYTPLQAAGLTPKVAREYNVLLLPDGDDYRRVFGAEGGWLRPWVEAGGTLVALGGAAAEYLVSCGDRFTTARLVTDLRPEPERTGAVPLSQRPADLVWVAAWVDLDPCSFLTYGCPARLRVPYGGRRLFTPPVDGYAVATFSADEPVSSGFAEPRARQTLPGHVYLWHERLGAGHVVAFAAPPTFRASWPVLDRLWLNAALLGPSLKRE